LTITGHKTVPLDSWMHAQHDQEVILSNQDLDDLRYAKALLEDPGLAAKLTNLIGIPIEKAIESLPKKASTIVDNVTKKSLEKALHFALLTMEDRNIPD
jgi:hypothetical protein